MSKFSYLICGAAAIGTIASLSTGIARAATYSDTFARTTAPAPLNGSAPTVGPAGATWTADSGFTTTAAPAAAVTSSFGSAELPFTVTPGTIATTSATLTPTGGATDGNWLAFGFLDSGNTSQSYGNFQGFVLYRGDGGTQYVTSTNGAGFNNGGTAATPGSPDTFTITLNDTNPASPTITFADTLGLTNSTSAFTGNVSNIGGVGFSTYAEPGTFQNFSATDAVPEPATLGVLGLGGLALLARKRRRTA